jgi:hypothetical protein
MSNKNFFADPGTNYIITSTLASDINTSVSLIPISNASNFPDVGSIQINNEIIKYSQIITNVLQNCIRGTNNTTSATHTLGSNVTLLARQGESSFTTNDSVIYPGWYKERGNNNKTLRLADSNLMMKGTVRFNETLNIFQGFDGENWVSFNAEKGDPGVPGNNASSIFNFTNLPNSDTTSGKIYQSSDSTDVYLRSLKSGLVDINAAITGVQALSITNDTNYINLTPTPVPYVWDFTNNNYNNLSFLKSLASDAKFKAFGNVSKWKVASNKTVNKGCAVRITIEIISSISKMVIEPYTYTNLNNFATNRKGLGFLGIALETKSNGESCEVCTEGITTVLLGSNPIITSKNSIFGPGEFGFINYDSKIFMPNDINSLSFTNFITNAGYWIESDNTEITPETGLGLFYVKGTLKI